MPPTEWQILLIGRLDTHDAATKRIESKLDNQDEKIDSIRSVVTASASTLKLHEHRLSVSEKKIGRLGSDFSELSTQTGQHRVIDLQKELDDLRSGKRYWVRWVVGGIFAIATGLAGWLAGR